MGTASRDDKAVPFRPIYSAVYSVFIQLIGFGAGVFAARLGESALLALFVHAGAAYLFASLLGLSWRWRILNALLPFAWKVAYEFALPPWLTGLVLLVVLLIYLPTFWTRVPYFPTHPALYAELLARLPTDAAFRFIDLGSGFGSLLLFLAKERPNGAFIGSELGPLPYLLSRIRSFTRKNVEFSLKSFWNTSLAEYDFVYAFLAPGPVMERLWEKAQREMKPGSVFITNSFAVPATPDETIEGTAPRQHALYLYRMGGSR